MTDYSRVQGWRPDSWKKYRARQQPAWADPSGAAQAQQELEFLPPLVPVREMRILKENLALAAEGKAFVLQGGDCSENFAQNNAKKISKTCKTLASMAFSLSNAMGRPVVKIGRMAGQFAKPRSSDTQTVAGIVYPSYRGDLVNDAALDLAARTPDPRRILKGYAMARDTLAILKALDASTFLSALNPEAWNDEFRAFFPVYTSHEALLLPYEAGLLRRGTAGDGWYAGSGHMLWIGERTRQLDSAHVELLRGVSNPIGVKVGPDHSTKEISRLCGMLNPNNEPGRLSLITRFGKDKIRDCLPPLIREIADAGRRVVWISDPMHGNTVTSDSGYKTRKYGDIFSEIQSFFRIHAQEKTVPGGIHLEMTGEDVTECTGGSCGIRSCDLEKNYLTTCDPRLNEKQSLELARDVGRMAGAVEK
ncbi:MAG: 3-deoxy-7-phosphoheptulonate synthase [Desulfobacter sp.]|nr:MAG: 3-deoxy-7-phosphoheptulonate synthase [Desulfobacter sp.]